MTKNDALLPCPTDKFDPTREENWRFCEEYDYWYIPFPLEYPVIVGNEKWDRAREHGFKPWEHIDTRPTPAPLSKGDGELARASLPSRETVDLILKGIKWIEEANDLRFARSIDAKPALLLVAKAAEAWLNSLPEETFNV